MSKMERYFLRILVVILAIGVRGSVELDCTPLADTDQVTGKTLYIPQNQQTPVTLPANFNCTYTVKPPIRVYAQITVSNLLKSANDVITVIDGQNTKTLITKTSSTSSIFYVFPQTVTTITIDNQDPTSQCLVTIVYKSLPDATTNQLQKNQNLNYLTLTSVQLNPVTYASDEPITLTLGRSGHITDDFSNYFVIDGSLDSTKSIRRLSDFQTSNFNSTGNILSIVGLDTNTSFSTVMFTPTSASNGFSLLAGVAVNPNTGVITVRSSDNLKKGVMIVAPMREQLVLTGFLFTKTSDSCSAIASSGPPGFSQSKTLIDFVNDPFNLPQIFPFPYFSIITQNCDIQFQFGTVTPAGYYQTDKETSGYIFSPSYLNSASKSDFNVTFEYTRDDKKQFVVDVIDVEVNSNAELDIDIFDGDLKKTLSAVITGNQMGTRSKAFGKYLNVHMSGNGNTKLRWQLTSSVGQIFGLQSILLLVLVFSFFNQ